MNLVTLKRYLRQALLSIGLPGPGAARQIIDAGVVVIRQPLQHLLHLPVVGSALHTKDLKGDTNFNTELFWVDSRKNGADAWIKGYVRYFVDLGFDFLRVDFLNNYEDNYGTEAYAQALKWISEAAGDDILVSLVMPNAKNWAENERLYGDMFRISNDVFGGGWDFISNRDRGIYHEGWPSWGNIFDGFVQRSVISRSEIMADGDFVRLNTCASDEEREFWLSLLAMAGSPSPSFSSA